MRKALEIFRRQKLEQEAREAASFGARDEYNWLLTSHPELSRGAPKAAQMLVDLRSASASSEQPETAPAAESAAAVPDTSNDGAGRVAGPALGVSDSFMFNLFARLDTESLGVATKESLIDTILRDARVRNTLRSMRTLISVLGSFSLQSTNKRTK